MNRTNLLRVWAATSLALGLYAWGFMTVQFKYFPYSIIQKIATGNSKPVNNEKNVYWANKIKGGGYILYFRHSQRKKVDLIKALDIFEILNSDNSQESTCLTKQGKLDARLIGQMLNKIGVNAETIVSTPLCRSKQTALIAFNRIDSIENAFIYQPLLDQSQYKLHSEKIKKSLLKYSPIRQKKNTIIVAHATTLDGYAKDIFNSYDQKSIQGLDESGFYVIQVIGGNIFLRHTFKSFNDFSVSSNLIKLNQKNE